VSVPQHATRADHFPVTLRVIPSRLRSRLGAVYGYADLVEGSTGGSADERLGMLDDIGAQVRAIEAGDEPRHPVLCELAPPVRAGQLPVEPLLRLIEAARADQVVYRYGTIAQLVEYCQRAAAPVGELTLHVFGQATAERVALSDRICTALRMIEQLQDLGTGAGRRYLLKEDLDRFGVASDDLERQYASWPLRNVIAYQAERARAFLEAGAPLVGALRGWARLTFGAHVAVGRAGLAALSRAGFDPIAERVHAGRGGVVGQWLRATVRSAG
jgi:squalene synthase HpnC